MHDRRLALKWVIAAAVIYALCLNAAQRLVPVNSNPHGAAAWLLTALGLALPATVAGLVSYLLRRGGAPVAVFWAAAIPIALSALASALVAPAIATLTRDELARLFVPWPWWTASKALVLATAYAGTKLAPVPEGVEVAPPRALTILGAVWIGVSLVVVVAVGYFVRQLAS